MVYIDQTSSFQSLISEGSSRSASPSGRRDSRSRDRKGKGKGTQDEDVFLQEAYRIHVHLSSLTTLVSTIRKPYLSLTEPPLSRRHRPTYNESTVNGTEEGNPDADGDGLGRWKASTYLTDRERDEIDLRGRMILRRCKERLGDLERSERARQITKAPLSRLQTLLPSLAPQTDQFESLIKAHRSSILWTLNDRLAKASASLTDLQEERSRRREERGRSLGGQASKEAAKLGLGGGKAVSGGSGGLGGLGGWSMNGLLAPSQSTSRNGSIETSVIPTDEPPIESQLTPAQLQSLESENSALLENMESTLSSVLSAEKSLLEISALQTELVKNLVQQTELTDRLYEEAVGSVGEMKKAGQQLQQAKKRGEEGRMFLLIFLFGASMALLFLDWYAS